MPPARRVAPRRTRSPAGAAAVLLAAAILASPPGGAACSGRSGGETVPLVELYTSEGCNSCPPADRWLSATFPPGEPRPAAIALAFHVDYWDGLGWKDRFATAASGDRQRDAARANRGTFVYTPQVLLQGREFPEWRSVRAGAALAAIRARPALADIAVDARLQPASIAVEVRARVAQPARLEGARVGVALVDSGLVSQVEAGENAGVRLVHDHVVRSFATLAVDRDGETHGTLTLARPAEAGRDATIVAFVQSGRGAAVLQALAVPLEGCARTP